MYTILYFLDYGKFFGGAVNTLLQQAILMKTAGNRVIVLFSDYLGININNVYEEIYSKYDIEIEYATYQIASQPEDIDVICLEENYEKMREKIKRWSPNLMHSVQINPIAELIGRDLQIPHIMSIYPLHPDFFSIPYADIFSHYHICDSWYWAKRWNQYLHTDFTCVRTVVLKPKANSACRDLLRRKVKYICVGGFGAGKNQLGVIKAFHSALKKGIAGELAIYGYDANEYTKKCKCYIENSSLAEDIKINGFCPHMNHVYKESDVLICGSIRESYPNVISEAMAYGLTVISTPVAGVPEVIKDGINGYLAKDFTSEAIADKILEFQNDVGKEKLKRIKKNALETFEWSHTPEMVTGKLLEYYQHVLQKGVSGKVFGINELREMFLPWKEIFYQNYHCFSEPQKVASKIWYLFHIKDRIESVQRQKADFFIWGTGKYGIIVKEIIEIFFPEIQISGYIDSKKTGFFEEYRIYVPEEILQRKESVIFLAAVNGQDEMIEKLNEKKKTFNKDYFILSARKW